MGRIVAELQ